MKTKTATFVWLLLNVGLALAHASDSADEAYHYLAGSVHLDSYISGGEMGIDQLVETAKDQGAQVVIITDNDNKWVTYGVLPLFRHLTRYTRGPRRNDGSKVQAIKGYGARRYIRAIENAGEQHEIIAIPGVEAVPYYRWEGKGVIWNRLTDPGNWANPLKWVDLKLKNWHRHLLVIGLENAEDYKTLPSLGNETYPLRYDFSGILQGLLNLTPLLLVALGVAIFRFRATTGRRRRGVGVGVVFILVGLILLWRAFPFLPRQYHPYQDFAEAPYQYLIDDVNKKGGMVFWAHPEGGTRLPDVIEVQTDSYEHLLSDTTGYTGFAIFVKGMKKIGRAYGHWDNLLLAYCRGERERPIWAIGETDFEGGGPPEWVRDTQTVFLVKKADFSSVSGGRSRVLEAMRNGRMYATTRIYSGADAGTPRLHFRLQNARGETATMGEKLIVESGGISAQLKLSIEKERRFPKLTVQIIRSRPYNNKIQDWVKPIDNVQNASITFKDKSYLPEQTIYYRILVFAGKTTDPDKAIIASNPIFVEYR
jgi:hypothetical protein